MRDNRFKMPQHRPKFLGLVYSRLGMRGCQMPRNQFAAMASANATLVADLLPCLRARGMLLQDAVYVAAADAIPTVRRRAEVHLGASIQCMSTNLWGGTRRR